MVAIAAFTSLGTTSPRYIMQHAMYLPWRGSHLVIMLAGSKHELVISATERDSWYAFSAEMIGEYADTMKWMRGYGTRLVWNSVRSTLRAPSKRREAVREKKSRLEVDKQRRKVEADLKVCQEKVTDLEREKKDIEGNIQKKDAAIVVSQRRLEDEQAIVAKAQKAIKELQSRVETSEEELEAERQARSKSEKQRGTLA